MRERRLEAPLGGSRPGAPEGRARRVLKLYDEVRTAHLERLADGTRTTILFRQPRYDFDDALARGFDLRRAGALGTLRYVLLHEVDVIELSEPLVTHAAARSLMAVVGNRLRSALLRRPPAPVVTYAIESIDPGGLVDRLPWKALVRYRASAPLVPLVWRSLDRVAFGTRLSEQVYDRAMPGGGPSTRVIPALPASRLTATTAAPRGTTLLFLGDLSARKGFPELLRAWPLVQRRVPGARLTIVGRGAGAEEARALAARDPSVTAVIDPPRALVFDVLSTSKVLVLPSQRAPLWREQVGLPIVEGLSFGCTIVASTETGLADWLASHGHAAVDPGDAEALVEAIAAALVDPRTPRDVVQDLPEIDGRLAAERWLHEAAR